MSQEMIQKLKRLNAIKPDPDFVLKSRRLILAVPPARPVLAWPWVWAGALAAIAIIAVSAVSSGLIFRPNYASLINPDDIAGEFNNLTINIQLEQIGYQQNINSVIASALNEISDQNPYRANSSLLENEFNSLDVKSETGNQQKIDDLLKEVIE